MKRKMYKINNKEDLWMGKEGITRSEIIKELRKKNAPIKMSELQESLKHTIKSRGSLRHHLKLLEKYGYIHPLKRKEDEYGRPTYIKLNNDLFDKEKKDREGKIKKYIQERESSPLNEKIINLLKEKDLSFFEIENLLKKEREDITDLFGVLYFLESTKKIKNVWKLNKNHSSK